MREEGEHNDIFRMGVVFADVERVLLFCWQPLVAPPQFYQFIALFCIFLLCCSLLDLSVSLSLFLLAVVCTTYFLQSEEKSKNSWGISTPAKSGAEQHLPTNQRITETEKNNTIPVKQNITFSWTQSCTVFKKNCFTEQTSLFKNQPHSTLAKTFSISSLQYSANAVVNKSKHLGWTQKPYCAQFWSAACQLQGRRCNKTLAGDISVVVVNWLNISGQSISPKTVPLAKLQMGWQLSKKRSGLEESWGES